jgi:ketosteroid isomerase-like protein
MNVLRFLSILIFSGLFHSLNGEVNHAVIKELDAYWAEVERCVKEGDFAAYSATFHEDAVLVSGVRGKSEPISQALSRWKKGIDATREGKVQASVEIRLKTRIHDATTAHDSGIFLYKEKGEDGKQIEDFIHFEALLVKKDCKWLITMEYQKSKATLEEWKALEN